MLTLEKSEVSLSNQIVRTLNVTLSLSDDLRGFSESGGDHPLSLKDPEHGWSFQRLLSRE